MPRTVKTTSLDTDSYTDTEAFAREALTKEADSTNARHKEMLTRTPDADKGSSHVQKPETRPSAHGHALMERSKGQRSSEVVTSTSQHETFGRCADYLQRGFWKLRRCLVFVI